MTWFNNTILIARFYLCRLNIRWTQHGTANGRKSIVVVGNQKAGKACSCARHQAIHKLVCEAEGSTRRRSQVGRRSGVCHNSIRRRQSSCASVASSRRDSSAIAGEGTSRSERCQVLVASRICSLYDCEFTDVVCMKWLTRLTLDGWIYFNHFVRAINKKILIKFIMSFLTYF